MNYFYEEPFTPEDQNKPDLYIGFKFKDGKISVEAIDPYDGYKFDDKQNCKCFNNFIEWCKKVFKDDQDKIECYDEYFTTLATIYHGEEQLSINELNEMGEALLQSNWDIVSELSDSVNDFCFELAEKKINQMKKGIKQK